MTDCYAELAVSSPSVVETIANEYFMEGWKAESPVYISERQTRQLS